MEPPSAQTLNADLDFFILAISFWPRTHWGTITCCNQTESATLSSSRFPQSTAKAAPAEPLKRWPISVESSTSHGYDWPSRNSLSNICRIASSSWANTVNDKHE